MVSLSNLAQKHSTTIIPLIEGENYDWWCIKIKAFYHSQSLGSGWESVCRALAYGYLSNNQEEQLK